MTRRLSSPVLVGRSKELDVLLAAGEAALAGAPALVLVGGEAGVGKTRLTEELSDRLAREGWLTLRGSCVPLGSEGLPFGPIAESLRTLARTVPADEIAAAAGGGLAAISHLVPELGGDVQQRGDAAEWRQTQLFEALLGLLGGLTAIRPVLLIVDDVHWADALTRDLLAFLARRVRDERLLLVATLRMDEVRRGDPLTSWLAELARLPRVERLDLDRLDEAALGDLIAAIIGSTPDPALVTSIARRSEGNAFFAEELLAARGGDGLDALPSTLREVLLVRLGSVSDAALRLAEVAAVAGRAVRDEVLRVVVGRDHLDVEAALRELVDAQLLVPDDALGDPGEAYRFRHALVAEAIERELLPAQRRRLHAAHAAALEAGLRPDEQPSVGTLVEIAHHWTGAHEHARALAAAMRAGAAAAAAYAYAEAANQYERAIELWDRVPPAARPSGVDVGTLLEDAASVAALVGRSERALELGRRSIEAADAVVDETAALERRAAARAALAVVAQRVGETPTSIAALREAIDLLEAARTSQLRTRLLERLAAHLMIAGEAAASEPYARRAIEEAATFGDRSLEANALATLGPALANLGDVERGIDAARQAALLARALDDAWIVLRSYGNLGSVLEAGGLLEEAFAASMEGADVLRGRGAERTLFGAALEINGASVLVHLGRFDAAMRLLAPKRAAALPSFVTLNLELTWADLAMRQGDLKAADEHLQRAWADAGGLADAHFTIDLHATAVGVATWSGDLAGGLELSRVAFDRTAGKDAALLSGQLAIAALQCAAEVAVTARAGRDDAAAESAARSAEDLLDRYRTAIERLPRPGPLAARELGWRLELCEAELARARGRDEAGQWASLAERVPRPFLASYARWREAELRARGRSSEAAAALREAHRLAVAIGSGLLRREIEGLARRVRVELPRSDPPRAARGAPGDVPVPEPAAAVADPLDRFGLTPRERDVLALLVEGRTNRELAERLFISESTAGVHVSNILGKLGARTRAEAAGIAARLGVGGETA